MQGFHMQKHAADTRHTTMHAAAAWDQPERGLPYHREGTNNTQQLVVTPPPPPPSLCAAGRPCVFRALFGACLSALLGW